MTASSPTPSPSSPTLTDEGFLLCDWRRYVRFLPSPLLLRSGRVRWLVLLDLAARSWWVCSGRRVAALGRDMACRLPLPGAPSCCVHEIPSFCCRFGERLLEIRCTCHVLM